MNEKEGINILPIMGGSNTDTATAMAMKNKNTQDDDNEMDIEPVDMNAL